MVEVAKLGKEGEEESELLMDEREGWNSEGKR